MGQQFLGEIRLVSFDFAPKGWAECNGALLPISQNQALFSLLGTTYGGDGKSTFALPDLRGRVPVSRSDTFGQGELVGAEFVALAVSQIPAHRHPWVTSAASPDTEKMTGGYLSNAEKAPIYAGPSNLVAMSTSTLGNAGSGLGHPNMQPYLVLKFVVAVTGIFPPRG